MINRNDHNPATTAPRCFRCTVIGALRTAGFMLNVLAFAAAIGAAIAWGVILGIKISGLTL